MCMVLSLQLTHYTCMSWNFAILSEMWIHLVYLTKSAQNMTDNIAIGTTRPIPPNRRSCLGCIWWKDMSNPKLLRWNIVLTETYESRSAITNQSEHLELGQFRLTGDRAKYSMYSMYSIQYIDGDVTMC